MLNNPVVEQYRLENKGKFIGTITIAYPNRNDAILLGYSGGVLKPSLIKEIIKHIRKLNKTRLIFYRVKNNRDIRKVYEL